MRRRHGGDTDAPIDLSASLNPHGPPERVRKVIEESASNVRKYPYEPRRKLREQLARLHNVSDSEIVIDAGVGGLLSLLAGFCRGQSVQVLVPTFTEYEDLIGSQASRLKTVSVDRSEDGIAGLPTGVDPSTFDVVILCNPNNPTGQCIPTDRLKSLLEECERNDSYLIVDEAYVPFTEDPSRWSLENAVTDSSNLIVLRSLTKIYGMAGLRVGYMLADRTVTEEVTRRQNPWPVGQIALSGAIEALDDKNFQRKTTNWLRSEKKRVFEGLRAIPDVSFVESMVNFCLVQSPMNLQAELRKNGITIRKANSFTGLGSDWYRISLGTKQENQNLLSELEQLASPPEPVVE